MKNSDVAEDRLLKLFFSILRPLSLVLLATCSAQAFPPAPYHTLYGTVRDQVGQAVNATGSEIILLKDGAEVGRAPINSAVWLDQNYDLKIRVDQNRGGTNIYTERAIPSQGLFSLVVEMNGALFYPIKVAGELSVGNGGERVRLDLNLGEDGDLDGLPDVWEQWQLFQAGYNPDDSGNWPIELIDLEGDWDSDGLSNRHEYIAGTFAGDATENLDLRIVGTEEGCVHFEFFAITGKTYTIERSMEVSDWTRVPFSVERLAASTPQMVAVPDSASLLSAPLARPGESVASDSISEPAAEFERSSETVAFATAELSGEASEVYQATAVGIVTASATSTPGAREFYQLTVR